MEVKARLVKNSNNIMIKLSNRYQRLLLEIKEGF